MGPTHVFDTGTSNNDRQEERTGLYMSPLMKPVGIRRTRIHLIAILQHLR